MGKEPAAKGLVERAVLEGSFLAYPLLSMASDLNRNLAALSPAPWEHQKDQLCPSRAGTAGWLRSHPNKPRGIPYFKPKKAGKPPKGISAKTDHNLPKTFQGTFSIHSQSHPSPTRAVAVIVYHTASVRKPTSRGSEIFLLPAANSPGSPKGGDGAAWGDGGPKGDSRDDACCNGEADCFIAGGQNYSGNHRGSNWKLLDRETSPFCFQMCRPRSLC